MTLTGDAHALVPAQDPSWRHGLKRNSPMEVPVHARPVLVAAFLGLLLATSAGAAVDAGSSVGFRFLPQKTFQGQPATLSVIARPKRRRLRPDNPLRGRSASVPQANGCARQSRNVELQDCREGADRHRDRHRQVRSCRQDHTELRRRRAASRPRQGRGQEERLLAARSLDSARGQLWGRALERFA